MARSLLQLPKSQAAALARLIHLTPDQHNALARAVEEARPCFSTRSLASHVAAKAKLDGDLVSDILRFLTVLITVRAREDIAAPEFLIEVERAAKDTGRDELTDASIDWEDARRRIGDLLRHESIGITAKAFDVLNEHDRMFCDARILSDVRPVFAADVNHSPDALVLIHELRISYHQGGDLKAIYIAMDSSDIRDLREVLDRASKKEASLETLAKNAAVQLLKAESHEG